MYNMIDYIIEHWFVGFSGFSVASEVTMTTGFEITLTFIGFILVLIVF
jgi:hypothetical protein